MAADKKRWTACWPKPNPEMPDKPHWIDVGIAYENAGGSIKVRVDAIPIGWDGQLVLFAKAKKEPKGD